MLGLDESDARANMDLEIVAIHPNPGDL